MLKIAHVYQNHQSTPVLCTLEDLELDKNDFCVYRDLDGMEQTGFLHNFVHLCDKQLEDREMSVVLRRANSADVRAWHYLKKREVEALAACKEKTVKHKLTMKISSVKFDDRQHKVVFLFTADKRVDFRELVKDLASTFHARIELWQVGVRDEARNIGGLGCCGLQMCCSRWMRDFVPVSIRFAKAQDIQFSPSKLSGVCGRLRCCLAYEQRQYQEMGKGVPPVGSMTESDKFGRAKVIDRNLLSQTLNLLDGEGKHHALSLACVKCKKMKTGEKKNGKEQVVWKLTENIPDDMAVDPEKSFWETPEREAEKPAFRAGKSESSEPPKKKSSPRDGNRRKQSASRPPRTRGAVSNTDTSGADKKAKTLTITPDDASGEGNNQEKPARPGRRRRNRSRRRGPRDQSKTDGAKTSATAASAKTGRDGSREGGDKKSGGRSARRRNDQRRYNKKSSGSSQKTDQNKK